MIIRPDEVDRIAIDRFTSTSGLYVSLLTSRFERGYNVFYIVVVSALSTRVLKIVRIGRNAKRAKKTWEDWRAKFAYKSHETYETDAPDGITPIRWSPPILIKEDLTVLKMNPVGGQIFIRDITPVDNVTARAQAAGIVAAVAEENKPRPTCGIVLKFGTDPFLLEHGINVGDIVMFSPHAGGAFTEDGYDYRHIQLHEIIGYRKADDGVADLLPPNLPKEMIDWAKELLPTLLVIAESKPIEPITTEILT